MINETMKELGNKRSVIREIFEFGNRRRAEIGAENVYDFTAAARRSVRRMSMTSVSGIRTCRRRSLSTAP